jgi:Ca2+-transporting ATPase
MLLGHNTYKAQPKNSYFPACSEVFIEDWICVWLPEERFRFLHEADSGENLGRKGLRSSQVQELRKSFGLNRLPEKEGRSALTIYLSQFKNPLIYVITAAAIISVILRDYNDALIITIVILLDSVVGFFQEHRAEKAVVALRGLLKPTARVIRDGQLIEIDASEIVPGDVIAVNDGDRIAADGELIEAVNLNINEAILTGESEPVVKDVSDPVYMGTTALSGRGLVKVTSIGISTELGKIADSLSEMKEEPTPLQTRLEGFGRSLTYIVIVISAVILGIGTLSGIGFLEMVKVAVVLAIAAIPEGLPIAVTMILVIGMRAILRRRGLVKKLLAVETLGSVTVICTDKTGTLTEGIMQVVRTDFRHEKMAVHVMALCNNLADSLEVTLWNRAKVMGVDPQALSEKCKRTHEVPFSSERKYMLTVNVIEGAEVALLKGAPEIVLDFCSVSQKEKKEAIDEFTEWANSGLKVLALAYKKDGQRRELKGFEWLGLVGIEDPIRPSVKDAVALCHKAGIKVKVVTGDYRGTAQKVAAAIGLSVNSNQILEGKELETMSEPDLAKIVGDVVLFCRVAPHHKLKIVNALQKRGEVTAMIGDGVNDAPALKKANIGVSVGNATDVAKETASLILLDNNFKTLVDTVEEGRIVFDNIKKVVAYVLSNSFAEIFTIFGAMILGWPAPLTVPQILWIHLICDGPSDIVLGFERGEVGIMNEKPKSMKESILDKWAKTLILAISLISATCSLVLFWSFWQIYHDIDSGRTIVFTVLAVQELIYIFAYRSLRHSLAKSGNFFANKWLFGTVGLGFAQQLLALYIPALNNILGVVPLHLNDWILVFIVGFGILLIVETVKYLMRHPAGMRSLVHLGSAHSNNGNDEKSLSQ